MALALSCLLASLRASAYFEKLSQCKL